MAKGDKGGLSTLQAIGRLLGSAAIGRGTGYLKRRLEQELRKSKKQKPRQRKKYKKKKSKFTIKRNGNSVSAFVGNTTKRGNISRSVRGVRGFNCRGSVSKVSRSA